MKVNWFHLMPYRLLPALCAGGDLGCVSDSGRRGCAVQGREPTHSVVGDRGGRYALVRTPKSDQGRFYTCSTVPKFSSVRHAHGNKRAVGQSHAQRTLRRLCANVMWFDLAPPSSSGGSSLGD